MGYYANKVPYEIKDRYEIGDKVKHFTVVEHIRRRSYILKCKCGNLCDVSHWQLVSEKECYECMTCILGYDPALRLLPDNLTPEQSLEWIKNGCTVIDECWFWNGNYFDDGYPRIENFVCNSTRGGRVVLKLVTGREDYDTAMHSCDNPECVNPAHLSAGSYQDNARDMCAKGRHKKRNNIDEAVVKLIRADIDSKLMPHEDILNKYMITWDQFRKLKDRITWSWV